MPGLVVFRRRWSAGSDDLVVPGAILLIIHLLSLVMVLTSLTLIDYNNANAMSIKVLIYHQFGYLIILSLSICTELAICVISMRGSILDTEQRTSINAWIYTKSVILLIDIIWLILGSWALVNYYQSDVVGRLRKLFLGVLLTNWALVMVTIITVWCSFDMAGRSWVKMKKYQRSMRDSETRLSYRRSNSINRNWRQRKVMRAYQDSWNQRCRLLFCCIGSTERSRNSFTDIARLLSDFFRELDVVPSDVVAGLVLLRKFQRLEREAIIRQRKNGTYEFLSGVPITDRTKFLALNDPKSYDFFQTVIHYMYFAQGAYGWPLYLYQYRSRVHHLLSEMRCFGCCHNPYGEDVQIIQDNCCYCNYAALKKTLQVGDVEIIYVTYHVDVGETPFFVAIDYSQKKIVITIRGTLSMKDVLTDLNAESEVLPINPPRDDWLGHKGMVQAAIYIRNKLLEEDLIQRSFNKDRSRNTHTFGLVLVGHSLGAGTAAILAVLLKPDYPSIQCFCYSPPGGLLSIPVVEYSKSFITSVVLGKDVIPRIGLYQMEALRSDLINVIQRSIDPKWKTISCSMVCCGCGPEPTSVIEMSAKDSDINKYQEERDSARLTSTHPTDSSIALTIHQPLYPPGRIIHIVRHHPKPDEQKYERSWRNVLNSREPVFQAIWADTTDFDEVLISPVMLQDHMPDEVLAALKKVISASGPRKPHRQTSNTFNMPYNNDSIKCDEDNVNCVYDNDGDDNFNIVQLSKNDMAKNATLSATSYDISVNLNSNLSNFYLGSPYANQNNPILNQQFKCTNDSNIMNGKVTIDNLTSSKSLPSSSSSLSIPSTPSSSNISQYSSVECNTSSVVINDTVTQKIIIPPFMVSPEAINETGLSSKSSSFTITRNATCKTVAFDVNDCIQTNNGKSNKFMKKKCGISDDILQRQSSERLTVSKCHQSSLHVTPQTQRRRASIAPNHLDLTYDEWFGFAPLASPETLSEISSISSRNSIRNMSNNNITNNNKSNNSNNNNINNNNNYNNNNSKLYTKSVLDDIFESQLHTPTVLRRAPKFIENLSTCAEDSRNLDQYKRMSRVIRKTQSKYKKQPFKFSSRSEIEKSINNNDTNANYDCHDIDNDDDDNDNDDDDADDDGEDDTDSFETAKSFKHSNGTAPINKLTFNENERENSKSADQLDELRPSSSSSRPFEYGYEQKLTCSDSNILNDNDNNEQFNCCNMNDINHIERIITKEMCLSGSGDITYYSANSSIERVACSTQTNIIGGLLESHFPIQDEYQQLQHQQQQQQQQQHRYQYQFTTNDIPLKKKEKRNQKCLLGQTDETNYSQVVQFTGNYYKSSPPTNRKRKACVYPLMTTTATIITTETITTTTEKPKQIISSSSSSSSSPLTVQSKITETSTSTTSATTAITTTSTAAAPVKVGVSVISKQSTVHIPSSGYMYKSHNESSV